MAYQVRLVEGDPPRQRTLTLSPENASSRYSCSNPSCKNQRGINLAAVVQKLIQDVEKSGEETGTDYPRCAGFEPMGRGQRRDCLYHFEVTVSRIA